jgi:oxygen-independent coproporphyrinogen-3 oxidase
VLGIYVHVPFCSAICNYCNFNRGLLDEALKTRFVDAVCQEIESRGEPVAADSIFFGGGTPSLLTEAEVARIVGACRAAFDVTPDAEVTLEANPESVSQDSLEHFRRSGVNRLSFGVQSFRDGELKRLGRLHSAERAVEAIRLARAAGFDNISLDLMMWLPGQDVRQWLGSVEDAIGVGPEHMSLYILEVYPHLPLKQDIDRFGWPQESDEGVADMYEMAMAMLESAGYEQYEISNVCRPGRQSRHNIKYWSDGDWLGFGPGAHSTWQGTRWRTVASTDDYIQRISEGLPVTVDRRTLSNDERLGDALFTGLRMRDGIDLEILSKRYGVDVWHRFGVRLAPYLDAGLLLRQDERLWLTRKGMLLANEVMSVFV